MIPTPYTLRVRRRASGEEDDFGNAGPTWVEHDWQVRQIDPGASVEPFEPNRDLSRILFTIHSSKSGDVPGERDQVRVDGEWFLVDGRPSDYTRGPWFNPVAGVVVMLSRVEG